MTQRYKASFIDLGAVVYDIKLKCLVIDLIDYSIFLRDKSDLSNLTVKLRLTHLVEFYGYLDASNIKLNHISDAILKSYRNAMLVRTRNNARSIDSVRAAKVTVNAKLASVYLWLLWMDSERRIRKGLIGTYKCQVLILPRLSAHSRSAIYPLMYKNTGKGSRHRANLAPSREILDGVVEVIMEGENEFVAQRDRLALDIAIETGMRRVSINSLTIDQFNREILINSEKLTFLVRPVSQKLGYEDEINFPVILGLQVCDYIEGARHNLLKDRGATENEATSRLFISHRSCKPITERAMSQSITRYMRKVGLEKGASMHSGRRLFAEERIDHEISRRLIKGMDTSTASVSEAVSLSMSHRSAASLRPYVASAQSRRASEKLGAKNEATR